MHKLIIFSSLLLLGCMLPSFADKEIAPPKPKVKLTVADFETRKIHGWTVHLEKTVPSNPQYKACMIQLNANLSEIEKLINPEILLILKTVPIWLNNDIRYGACYHPSVAWLERNVRWIP